MSDHEEREDRPETMRLGRHVWTDVTTEVFINMIERARLEDCFVNKMGRVDIGALLAKLIETYGNGTYKIIDPKKEREKEKKNHSNGVDYRAAHAEAPKTLCEDAPTESKVEEPKKEEG